MIKVYSMKSCPDCEAIKDQLKEGYEVIDIGERARDLKEFLQLRDHHPAFAKVRERGTIGIPCFVLEDGTIKFRMGNWETRKVESAASCSLDGSGC